MQRSRDTNESRPRYLSSQLVGATVEARETKEHIFRIGGTSGELPKRGDGVSSRMGVGILVFRRMDTEFTDV